MNDPQLSRLGSTSKKSSANFDLASCGNASKIVSGGLITKKNLSQIEKYENE